MESVRREPGSDYRERMLRVLVHIQQNLDSAISLEQLAGIARFSPWHFHRVFRGMVGESVMQHVRRLRLERAALRLKQSDEAITKIAFGAGYEAHESFTRAFHQAFGCSPSEYRASHSLAARTAHPSRIHYSPNAAITFDPLPFDRRLFDVRIERYDAMRVAFVRHTGPYDTVSEAWEWLTDWAGSNGLLDDRTEFFGACYDDPEVTDPEQLRYDACITVAETILPGGEIGVQLYPAGRFACVLHEGEYQRLNETYAALFGRWFPAHHLEPGDPPSFEFYLNDPNSTEPEDLQTEIRVRIKP